MQNKVILITGGSSGIGKSLAFSFGKRGSKIVITGRNAEVLTKTEKELTNHGITCLGIVADVSDEISCQETITKTINTFGRLDVLINNAGISMRAMFQDCKPEVIKKVMEINFFGTVYITHAALPYIIGNQGSILGISSIAGYRGLPVRTGYSASKFAMNGFLEALRTELLHSNVNVLTVAPGFTASNIRVASLGKDGQIKGESMRDEASMMSADVVAEAIYKATTSRKRTLILTTQGKFTVLMNKWFPKLMDTLVYNTLAKEENSPLIRK